MSAHQACEPYRHAVQFTLALVISSTAGALAVDPTVSQRLALPPGGTNWVASAQARSSGGLLTTDLNAGLTPTDLVNTLLGGGVTVSNVSFTGSGVAAGTFTGGTGIIGFDSGIVLGSGNIASVAGPNILDNTTTDLQRPGDADLNGLIPSAATLDATVLEFDFECSQTQTLQFQFVFSSEEYNEFVNAAYNDAFGFFLNGSNIAIVPDSGGVPVAINNVNCGNPYAPPGGTHCNLFINNDLNDGGGSVNTEMDGLTTVFTASAVLNPGINHIKLAIADVTDQLYDSNVFLASQSFTCDIEACCLPTGDCLERAPSVCLSDGGTPLGPGSLCQAPQSCCLADGQCRVIDPQCCALQEGSVEELACRGDLNGNGVDDLCEGYCEGYWEGMPIDTPCVCYGDTFNLEVRDLHVHNGTLFLAGGFAGLSGSCPGVFCQGFEQHGPVATWDGDAWRAFGDSSCYSLLPVPYALETFQGELYIGGSWNGCATLASAAESGYEASADTVACSGINFCPEAGEQVEPTCLYGRIAKWNGTDWQTLGRCGLNDRVEDLIVFDDGGGEALFVGGRFTATRGTNIPLLHIAKWDGNDWTPVGQGLSRAVNAFTVFRDCSDGSVSLYVGLDSGVTHAYNPDGTFVDVRGVAKWDGQSWSAVGQLGTVRALAVYDDGNGPALYAGGSFTVPLLGGGGADFCSNIAKWNGSFWESLSGGAYAFDSLGIPSGFVDSLHVFDDGSGALPRLYVGGAFVMAGGNWNSFIDGIDVYNIASWDGNEWACVPGGADGQSGCMVLDNNVHSMLAYDDGTGLGLDLYVGGFFSPPTPGSRNIARVRACGGDPIEPTLGGITVDDEDCNANGIPDACEPDHDCNANQVPDECEGSGDGDFDCVRDLDDYNQLLACWSASGPNNRYPMGIGCIYFDVDHDLDVDLQDFAVFQNMFGTTPDYCIVPADPCDNGQFTQLTASATTDVGVMASVIPNSDWVNSLQLASQERYFYYSLPQQVVLAITEENPFSFRYWRVDGVPQDPPYGQVTVTMDQARTATAVFSPAHVARLETFYPGQFNDQADVTCQFLGGGSTASTQNMNNSIHGITGLRVYFDDIVSFATSATDAFDFAWTTGTGTSFAPVADPESAISVMSSVQNGVSVVTILLDDDYVKRRWLRVTLHADQVTTSFRALDGEMWGNPVALPSGDGWSGGDAVFYLGNISGDVDGDRKTTLTDVGLIRAAVNPFQEVPITEVYDVDRDGKVLLNDVGMARLDVNPFFTLPLIAP